MAPRTGRGSPLMEIRRLRDLLSQAERQRDEAVANAREAQAQLAELRELSVRYIGATEDRTQSIHDLELDAYQRGFDKAQEMTDQAHMDGTAHDKHGRMNLLPVPQEVPEVPSADQRVADAEEYTRTEGGWWGKQFDRDRAAERREQQERADRDELRQLRDKQHPGGGEREAAS